MSVLVSVNGSTISSIYVLITGSPSFRGYGIFAERLSKDIEKIKAHFNAPSVILLSYGEGRIPEYVRRYGKCHKIGTIIGTEEDGILAYHRLKEAKSWVNVLFDKEPMFPVKQILNAPTFRHRLVRK